MPEEILSQNEIDALLSAITSGEMDAEELKKEEQEQKVRVYDFKRALRFSKDQIRSISRIHENYARLLTTFFSAQLRTYVNITVASVDQIPYEEFIRSIPKMTILNVYSVEPLEGRVLMEVNPNIAYSMMDRILGGKGHSDKQANNLTEIETLIMSQLFEKSVTNLQEAWGTIVDINPILEEFEVNPQFLQMVSPNETVVVVSLNTQIGDVSGMINICIPHIVLEPIIPKLSVHYWMETGTKERDPETYEQISRHIKQVQVEAKVILGQSKISVNELLNLKRNDIISLNQSIDEALQFVINNEPKMLVQAGQMKNRIAVQVLEEIKGGVFK
ncbi:flagellar motor switch protein FliM [Pseudogracilibacillus auburnensis]|uniref:Flagellar motor switch protein FliM n=1 Tax=Pseudogracilibacillus auburnensis TaxID=1494959 RepID=A0A2V3W4I0_9BACI|nr:flagellar motor switch protein FliM [Pseudogracilibacillus auburnensis]MBO1003798.1 flagellar motor switch protein FliM [Pseudogracilibacillus auburnensis]PXW88616.1 flagellar motor switch protein FliM [Pseudogracilibacillus auburnensis]